MEKIKSKRGGARPGAGRPRKDHNAAEGPGYPRVKPPLVEFPPLAGRVAPPTPAAIDFRSLLPSAALAPAPRPPGDPLPDTDHVADDLEPMQFLEEVMRGKRAATPSQIGAAKALMAYKHKKAAEESKRAEEAKKAQEVASKFARRPPPGAAAA